MFFEMMTSGQRVVSSKIRPPDVNDKRYFLHIPCGRTRTGEVRFDYYLLLGEVYSAVGSNPEFDEHYVVAAGHRRFCVNMRLLRDHHARFPNLDFLVGKTNPSGEFEPRKEALTEIFDAESSDK